ncbi:RNA polymerase I associated factor, A49-like protein [Cokeromyces recurvatus]|uniref:RNA polymerase I associated factor, A49-like protein n=1 Tax=Cokeromyces recurvatus TaxID=90255 RepID=UPI00221F262F|nr:RNA polymerase I associated factor, A49-like protein [Cokeromyces recurvatus]KAI7900800.1 RNA polymerase I associated factor, A49-like protein [Cokeromyces recurvatus]
MTKRKNSVDISSSRHVKVEIIEKKDEVETPYLATFPGTKPSSDMTFTAYKRQGEKINSKKSEQRIVTGETDKVTFHAANFGPEAVKNVQCKYIVGVYSKKNNSLSITNAPVMKMSRSVKALSSEIATTSRTVQSQVARTSLGLAFGTAKAKQQLKSEERNLVKGEDLANQMDNLHTEIGKATVNIPTKDEMKKDMETALPVPKYNINAESPDEVYDISSIVTDEELQSLNYKELLKETSLEGVQNLLAYQNSKFVNDRIMAILGSSGKKDRKRVRTLMYISILMSYYVRVRSSDLKNRRKVEAALKSPSSVIIDGLTERYTESNVRTPVMADKILLYMFTLILSISGYSVLIDQIGKDLLLKPTKIVTLFKNLGCKVDKASAEECRELNSKLAKKATLVVPLKFPEVRKGVSRR